jgi:hypothetical protein
MRARSQLPRQLQSLALQKHDTSEYWQVRTEAQIKVGSGLLIGHVAVAAWQTQLAACASPLHTQ